MIINFFKVVILLFTNIAFAQEFTTKNNPASVSIVPPNGVFFVEDKYYFGVKIDLQKGWKTYWKNPGDAGAPLTINWKDSSYPNKLEVLFPFPEKFLDHGVSTIGYEDQVIFPVMVQKNEMDKIIEEINLNYLVCKDICIPISETKKLKLDFQNEVISDAFLKNYKTVPKRKQNYFNIEYSTVSNEKIKVHIKNNNDFENIQLFVHSEDTNLKVKKHKSFFEISFDNNINSINTPINISLSNGKVYQEISFDLNKVKKTNLQIIYFVILAFLGGLILNLMPCVLPILSLKLYSFLSLVKTDNNKIRHNCSLIVAGIISSFLFLAITVIFLKTFGRVVGWGFQFQNDFFLVFILIVILIFSLNLLGFFEIILPQNTLYKINNFLDTNSKSGHYFSGVFATLLATPCSAPFLGTAVGFSMGSSNQNIIIIFISIAVGFSFPYLCFIILPKIVRLLPKPGEWMNNLKYFLGLLMLLSFVWISNLLKIDYLLILFFTSIVLFVSYFNNRNKFIIMTSLLFIATNILLFSEFLDIKKKKLEWENYDKNSLENYLNEDRFVLIDVTADWCVTCQFNKITTLNTKKVVDFLSKNKVAVVRADWTNKDKDIFDFIKKYERYGIPVNIVYGPNNKEGILLPEILSKDIVINKLMEVGVK
tara:strand:- start:116 stop:2065 length:1950 start_codon:yes stop_codon:yes gene_type:complete